MQNSKPPRETCHCPVCGGRFNRPAGRWWMSLCRSCYAWSEAFKAHQRTSEMLRRAR